MELNRAVREKTLIKLLGEGNYRLRDSEINFRCPVCGDSKLSAQKRRGWYNFDRDVFHCFNCHASFRQAFLKVLRALTGEEDIFKYLVEFLTDDFVVEPDKIKVPIVQNRRVYNGFLANECTVITAENPSIPPAVMEFWIDRKLNQTGRTFYWVHDKNSKFYNRVVIPFFNANGDCIYYQSRAVKWHLEKGRGSHFKYLNPMGHKNVVYNIDQVDASKPVAVLEGPIDAMFVENAIATMTCNITKAQLEMLEEKNLDPVFMYDYDEPGLKAMIKLAKKGFKVFMYPKGWNEDEDINEYVIRNNKKHKLTVETFVKPGILNPFQAEVLLGMELKKLQNKGAV